MMKNEQNWYIASLVVQVNQEKFTAVKAECLCQVGTEIHAEDQQAGKLVVVMESCQQADLIARMEAIQKMDGVVAVSLVYSYQDEPQP